MNGVGYFLLGAALGVCFHIWVLIYSVKGLQTMLDRFDNEQRWEVDVLQASVLQVNSRLWGAGMLTAEEERAKKRGCWTFDLPPEERTNRKEPLREQDNRERQRSLEIARNLETPIRAGRSDRRAPSGARSGWTIVTRFSGFQSGASIGAAIAAQNRRKAIHKGCMARLGWTTE